jgi:CheY-like chemotaxis protein
MKDVDVFNPAGTQTTSEALPQVPRSPVGMGDSTSDPPSVGDPFNGPRESSESGRPRLPLLLRGVRVLVVDDDEDTADVFAAALTTCGADVYTARSAADALRIVSARAPDVVVSDIAMPGADGYWLVGKIRELADARARPIPVIAVTAFGREHVRDRALTAGFVDYLEKPLDPEVLCVRVERARRG